MTDLATYDPTPDPLDDLALRERVRRSLNLAYQEELIKCVRAARLMGARWKDVGQALGVSAQSVHKRFRWVDDAPVHVGKDGFGNIRIECPRTGAVVHRSDLDRGDLGRGALTDLRARGLVDLERLTLDAGTVVEGQVVDDESSS